MIGWIYHKGEGDGKDHRHFAGYRCYRQACLLGRVGHKEEHQYKHHSNDGADGQPAGPENISRTAWAGVNNKAQDGSAKVIDYNDREGWNIEAINAFENNENGGG